MTRQQYKKCRQIFCENGSYGIRFIERLVSTQAFEEFYTWYWNIHQSMDRLAERESIVKYCLHEGLEYNFRQIK